MVQSRTIEELAQNSGVLDVIWVMTDPEREQTLLPIRIPIDRGLIGWRLALVNSQNPLELAEVRDAAGLRKFTAGQMHDWPDTTILRANAMNVETSSTYEGLFKQLATNRIDYFPRSALEIANELKSHASLPIAMDKEIIIRYPATFYFFVSKQRAELGADINKGLEAAIADGSFQRLFKREMVPLLEGLGLDKRSVIQLKNPLLPDATPLNRKELWFSLDELR